MKICTKCKVEKPLERFSPRKGRKSKYQPSCKDCMNAATKARRQAFPEKVKSEQRRFYRDNKEKESARCSKYRSENRDKVANNAAKRRAVKLKATPNWLTKEQEDDIKAMYTLAKKFEGVFNTKYHVDHIVPLVGKDICGLHVPWNLQLLPASVNLAKSNRYHGTEPFRVRS